MKIRFGRHVLTLPASRLVRMVLGTILIMGGLVGFLPVLGFWMIPLGLVVLSVDIPLVRAWRRRAAVRIGRWAKKRVPSLWKLLNDQP